MHEFELCLSHHAQATPFHARERVDVSAIVLYHLVRRTNSLFKGFLWKKAWRFIESTNCLLHYKKKRRTQSKNKHVSIKSPSLRYPIWQTRWSGPCNTYVYIHIFTLLYQHVCIYNISSYMYICIHIVPIWYIYPNLFRKRLSANVVQCKIASTCIYTRVEIYVCVYIHVNTAVQIFTVLHLYTFRVHQMYTIHTRTRTLHILHIHTTHVNTYPRHTTYISISDLSYVLHIVYAVNIVYIAFASNIRITYLIHFFALMRRADTNTSKILHEYIVTLTIHIWYMKNLLLKTQNRSQYFMHIYWF